MHGNMPMPHGLLSTGVAATTNSPNQFNSIESLAESSRNDTPDSPQSHPSGQSNRRSSDPEDRKYTELTGSVPADPDPERQTSPDSSMVSEEELDSPDHKPGSKYPDYCRTMTIKGES